MRPVLAAIERENTMNSRAKVYQYARPVKVAIVGGGFGCPCMAIKLRSAGVEHVALLAKADQ